MGIVKILEVKTSYLQKKRDFELKKFAEPGRTRALNLDSTAAAGRQQLTGDLGTNRTAVVSDSNIQASNSP